ncbi:MAG TPA: hypothetical protein VJL54_08745 [Nitrososphaera sp.]|nr:hypothetical protein [Nitrososphaera sp.]
MTKSEDRLFMLDLAVIQLIAGILVTLGSTLFAISIGFGLSIPPTVKEMLGELIAMKLDGISAVEQELFQSSINTYLLLLATIGVGFIIAGVLFAAARMNSMKRQLRNDLPERIAEEPRRSASETSEA